MYQKLWSYAISICCISWDMVCDRCNYFSFWDIFCPFTRPNNWKIQNLKKLKKYLEISSFYISISKITIIYYTVPEIRRIWRVTDVIVIFHFGLFFAFYHPNSPENGNFQKVKKPLEISSFYICVPKVPIR